MDEESVQQLVVDRRFAALAALEEISGEDFSPARFGMPTLQSFRGPATELAAERSRLLLRAKIHLQQHIVTVHGPTVGIF